MLTKPCAVNHLDTADVHVPGWQVDEVFRTVHVHLPSTCHTGSL
ncbi:MAG TPA: hypothetical protein PLI16_01700 [Bacteroidales bacterium]|nr:hypothetical protein [Bacteroidales bacterium]